MLAVALQWWAAGCNEKGVAVYEQNAARRAERLAARQAEEEYRAEEPADDYDDNFDEEDVPGGIPVPGGCPACSAGATR